SRSADRHRPTPRPPQTPPHPRSRIRADSSKYIPQLRYPAGMVAAFPTLPRGPAAVRAGWLAREIVVGAGAVALIVTSAELRLPIGVPGHRGLIWLTLLVAVAATSRARTTVLAVGAAS